MHSHWGDHHWSSGYEVGGHRCDNSCETKCPPAWQVHGGVHSCDLRGRPYKVPVYRRNLFTLGFSRIIKRGLEADLENKIYKVCPEGIQPLKTGIEEDTRDKKHCTWDSDASVPFKVGTWDLTQFSQSPSAVPSYFPESH